MRWKMMHCHHRHRHHSSFPAPGGGEEAPRSISCFSTLLGRIASIIASAAARGSAVETREGAGGEWECRAPSAGDICEEKHNTTKEGTQSTSATADENVDGSKPKLWPSVYRHVRLRQYLQYIKSKWNIRRNPHIDRHVRLRQYLQHIIIVLSYIYIYIYIYIYHHDKISE